MNSRIDFQTGFCREYEALLHRCEESREACSQWRADMNFSSSAHQFKKEIADELLRLQAKYAKAYARLEGHYKQCSRCQFLQRSSVEESCMVALATGTEQSRPS
jgi:hypothetical protein